MGGWGAPRVSPLRRVVPLARRGGKPRSGVSLLEREVEAFNAGVRIGDWSTLVELFTDDAELEFVGIPVGPFVGREPSRLTVGFRR